jgi:predicted AlkP superfamily pyrophosphatase or phosphodiesterase
MRTPGFDLFAEACARDIIAEFKPDLMLVHFSYLDHQRHQQGTAGEKIREALAFIDQRIGGIRAACGDAGILEDTVFFLLGDHGQIDVKEIFGINRALRDRGFINPGKTPDYRIFCHCAGFSGQIYTRNIGEKEAYRALLALREEYPRYIEAILTREEAYSRYGLAGDFSFVVEAAEGIGLGEESRGEISGRPSGKDFTAANHGHAPEKGPKPPFIVCGGLAKPGLRIPRAELIDEAPTILSLFGIPMPGADGRVLPLLA